MRIKTKQDQERSTEMAERKNILRDHPTDDASFPKRALLHVDSVTVAPDFLGNSRHFLVALWIPG